MKKMVFALVAMAAISFASCNTGSKSDKDKAATEQVVDSAASNDSLKDAEGAEAEVKDAKAEVKEDAAPAEKAAEDATEKK